MEGEQEEMVVGSQPQEADPEQGRRAEVEGTTGLLSSQLLGVLLRIGELGEVDQRQGEVQGRGNELDRLAVLLPDAGPQRFMALHDLLEAHLEGVALQGSIEVDREGGVVANLPGGELVEDPQLLLGSGEGQQGIRRSTGDSALMRLSSGPLLEVPPQQLPLGR
jgi:hypothetical protein